MRRSMTITAIFCIAIAGVGWYVADRYEASTHEEVYPESNYTAIEDGLLIGGMLSKLPPGVGVVLNVGETKDRFEAKVHRWEPMADLGPPPSIDWFRDQIEFVHRHRQEGTPVLVHCRAGVNRSVAVVAAYLMWRDGLMADQAIERIREKRSRAWPFEVYRRFLLDWEKALENKSPAKG